MEVDHPRELLVWPLRLVSSAVELVMQLLRWSQPAHHADQRQTASEREWVQASSKDACAQSDEREACCEQEEEFLPCPLVLLAVSKLAREGGCITPHQTS